MDFGWLEDNGRDRLETEYYDIYSGMMMVGGIDYVPGSFGFPSFGSPCMAVIITITAYCDL